MPTSKNKRKNGKRATGGFKHYVEQRKRIERRTRNGEYKSIEEARKDAQCIVSRHQWYERGQSRMAWITMLAACPDAIITAHTKAQFALRRWASQDVDEDDFNIVASSLMIGYLIAKRMPLEHVEDIFTALHEAAFMTVACSRLYNRHRPIPAANLQAIQTGLNAAQDLMQLADQTDRHIFIDVLEMNSKEAARDFPERQARWQKELLGRYAYTVEQWYESDWHEEAPWVRIEKKHEKHEEREL